MLLKNCRMLLQDKEIIGEILIDQGRIAKIGHNIKYDGKNVLDINKNHVLPGIIDPHVHFREPGMTHKEDFLTGSKAAAAGGITTFIDMPNTIPPTTTIKLLEEKRKLARKSVVNYGFHFGASVDNNIKEIKKVKNVASTKIFMNVSTGKMLIEDDDLLTEFFRNSELVAVHAEGEMVNKAIRLSKACGNRLYLCHISAREELDMIRETKTKDIFVEVTPHHLFLNNEHDEDSFTKMKPELKTILDNEALFKAINDGLVDTIGSDHAPHTVGEKLADGFPYGIPGCETTLPLLLKAVNVGMITLPKVIELCCHNPAKIFGIKNKGFIREGYDADLTIVDMKLEKKVDENSLFTKCGWSPFNGWLIRGWPVMTIVNGNVVFKDGKIDETHKGKEVIFNG